MGGSAYSFFSRSPFERMWCVQEIALGREVLVMCGHRTLSYDTMVHALTQTIRQSNMMGFDSIAQARYAPIFMRTGLITKLRSILHDRQRPPGSPIDLRWYHLAIADILDMARSRAATENVDKVFALHGLLEFLGIHMPPPKMGKPLDQVYLEAAIMCLHVDRRLDMLHLSTGDTNSQTLPIPSWVPNLIDAEFPMTPPYPNYDATVNSHTRFELQSSSRILVLWGKVIGTVAVVGDAMPRFPKHQLLNPTSNRYVSMAQSESAFYVLKQWATIAREYCSPDPNILASVILTDAVLKTGFSYQQFLPYFLRLYQVFFVSRNPREDITLDYTILNNLSYLANVPSASDQHFEFSLHIVASLLGSVLGSPFGKQQQIRSLHYWLMLMLRRRRLFVTHWTTQHLPPLLCLGTESVSQNDHLVLIQGIRMPMVARFQEQGQDSVWKLIGPSYVHGIMNGEAWDGGSDLMSMKFE